MKITVLVEDKKPLYPELSNEHGLCLFCESNGHTFLFDLGASGMFLRNAEMLKADIGKAEFAVISHAHYDHGGGLADFLHANKTAKVYLSKYAGGEYYVRNLIAYEYAALDRVLLSLNEDRLTCIEDDTEVFPGLHIISRIATPYPLPSFCMLMAEKTQGKYLPDPLLHEIFLCAEEADGVKVLTGCSHKGILNIYENAKSRFSDIAALVGGFHLYGTKILGLRLYGEPEKSVKNIADRLKAVRQVYTGHCTGLKAFRVLQEISGAKYLQTGASFEI